VIENLQERAAQVPGVKLYLQPVQDLTIDTETGLTLSFRAQGRRSECGQ
jgi:multidrug efflux pump